MFVKSVEFVNVHFLQRMLAAELVNLVVNLVKNPYFVVLRSIVFDCLLGQRLFESIDHLDLLEEDRYAARSATGDVVYFVGLEGHLDGFD